MACFKYLGRLDDMRVMTRDTMKKNEKREDEIATSLVSGTKEIFNFQQCFLYNREVTCVVGKWHKKWLDYTTKTKKKNNLEKVPGWLDDDKMRTRYTTNRRKQVRRHPASISLHSAASHSGWLVSLNPCKFQISKRHHSFCNATLVLSDWDPRLTIIKIYIQKYAGADTLEL